MISYAQIREEVLRVYTEVALDPVTELAAFGVACVILKDNLGCPLPTSALLLECWLTEAKLKNGG